jgi:phosphatidylglycerophosphatase A
MKLIYTTNMVFSRIYVTMFGVGYLPKAPGTWGSFFSLPIIWFLKDLSWQIFWVFAVSLISWAITRTYLISYKKTNEDPSEVVIDEFLGQWVALLFAPKTYTSFFLGFVLFRLFDMWKPWPVSWADQIKGPATKTSFGIIFDDILAGAIAGIILWLMYSYH